MISPDPLTEDQQQRVPRGFARMTPERQREVAASGGRARKQPRHIVVGSIPLGGMGAAVVRCTRCLAHESLNGRISDAILVLKTFLREHRGCEPYVVGQS